MDGDGPRSPLDDPQLRRAFRAGDRGALVAVYRALVQDVASLARRGFLLGDDGTRVPGSADPEDQRDVVQETFARAFAPNGRASYDGIRPLRPWVLRIAKNLIIDRHRRRGPAQCSFDAIADLDIVISEDKPFSPERGDSGLDARRLSAAVAAFLASVDDEHRRVHHARFVDGLGQEAAARALGVTRRRVRAVEDRLREGLRAHLQQHGLLDVAAARVGARPPLELGAKVALVTALVLFVAGHAACVDPSRSACRDSLDCVSGYFCSDGTCEQVNAQGRCTPRADGDDDCGYDSVCAGQDFDDGFRCQRMKPCALCDDGVCNDGIVAAKEEGCLVGRCLGQSDCFFDCAFPPNDDDALGICAGDHVDACFSDDDCVAVRCERERESDDVGTCGNELQGFDG